MKAELKANLPEATPVYSYDTSVWLEFNHKGAEYQLFDHWNFGANIGADDRERYWLSRYTPSREAAQSTGHEDHSEITGKFASPAEAFAALAPRN